MRADLGVLVFLTLFGTYAYVWQSRDWNSASRLMLTYAMVDAHSLEIDGLETQCAQRERDPRTGQSVIVGGDLAERGGHYYCDKAPGQSLVGALVYAALKPLGRFPDHPRHMPAMAYWPADYWATLLTSGLFTALTGALLFSFARRLGARDDAAVLVGIGYGLATPAAVYATLFYGHQLVAFCLLAALLLLYGAIHDRRPKPGRVSLAGTLTGFAIVTEYQAVLAAVALTVYAVIGLRRWGAIAAFLWCAGVSACLLAAYNYRAFGSPLALSYMFEASAEFQQVHSRANPLGVRWWEPVNGALAAELLWRPFRGLAVYAPMAVAALPGIVVLALRRRWGVALVVLATFGAALWVNLSYPLWQGGWCTGPRFLVPALPMLAVAVGALLGVDRHGVLRRAVGLAVLAGIAVNLGSMAVGGRYPPGFANPLREILAERWQGRIPAGTEVTAGGRQFEWNLGRWLIERFDLVAGDAPAADAPAAEPDGDPGVAAAPPAAPKWQIPPEPSIWQDLQFAPLFVFLLIMTRLLAARGRDDSAPRPRPLNRAEKPK
jgi:hypothetical protein